jgi:allantoinase
VTADTGFLPRPDSDRAARPRIAWPGGARVAFWVAPNIEFYELHPSGNAVRSPWPRPLPDTLNWSWRDYGNRVGVWRCLEIFDRHGIRGSVSLNAAMCRHLPEVVQPFVDRGWELFYHGLYNTRYLLGLDEAQEHAAMQEACDIIAAFSGTAVRGILAPALTYTESTFRNALACGLDYTLDLFNADAPRRLGDGFGQMLSVPYQVELNDFHVVVRDGASAQSYLDRFRRQFDHLYAEGAESGTVVGLPLHPYLIGLPQYAWALDAMLAHVRDHDAVWLTRACDIADAFRSQLREDGR